MSEQLKWGTEYLATDPTTEITLRVWKAKDDQWHWGAYDPFDGEPLPEAYLHWDAEGYDTFTEACLAAEKAFDENIAELTETYR